MDATNLRLLKSMREQIRGKKSRAVYSGDAARELGMAPGSGRHAEYGFWLDELVKGGYLQPHPNPILRQQEVYLITDAGITIADEE